MILLTSSENLAAASGLIDIAALDQIYHSFMDEAMLDMGRIITLHLPASVELDQATETQPQAGRYNPFFGGVVTPNTSSRGRGTKITTRDVQYHAQIVLGPLKLEDDLTGMGDLKNGQARITIDIGGLQDLLNAISISIEGRRYSVIPPTRPVGLNSRRYVIALIQEIQETETPDPDSTVG